MPTSASSINSSSVVIPGEEWGEMCALSRGTGDFMMLTRTEEEGESGGGGGPLAVEKSMSISAASSDVQGATRQLVFFLSSMSNVSPDIGKSSFRLRSTSSSLSSFSVNSVIGIIEILGDSDSILIDPNFGLGLSREIVVDDPIFDFDSTRDTRISSEFLVPATSLLAKSNAFISDRSDLSFFSSKCEERADNFGIWNLVSSCLTRHSPSSCL